MSVIMNNSGVVIFGIGHMHTDTHTGWCMNMKRDMQWEEVANYTEAPMGSACLPKFVKTPWPLGHAEVTFQVYFSNSFYE